MGYADFMQESNGRINILCDNIPDKGFISAIKIRHLCCARIIPRKEKAKNFRGGPDVEVVHVTGGREMITREQLGARFKHCNGKQIHIRNLRDGRRYFILSKVSPEEKYSVLKVPDNCLGTLNGAKVEPGSYIICKSNPDGTPDRATMYKISAKMFRKIFKIPMQNIIKAHMDEDTNKSFGLFNRNRLNEMRENFGHKWGNRANNDRTESNIIKTPTSIPRDINLGTGINTSIAGANNSNIIPSNPIQRTIPRQPQNINNGSMNALDALRNNKPKVVISAEKLNKDDTSSNTESKYRFTATHRVVSMTSNALIGYVIKDLRSGVSKQLKVLDVHRLCAEKVVDNLMLVTHENGIQYIRGNNIRIEGLPQVLA